MLKMENITRHFSGPAGIVEVLKGVSLQVAAGEFAAIQGPSGSGKTTLLLIAGGLMQPSAGEISVTGDNPYRLAGDERAAFRAARVGFVFQQFYLLPYLSVRDNIMAAALAKPDPGAGGRATELATRFGLGHRLGHRPSELSTGERQRTALARAVFNRPQLLLADEPTGNLDRESSGIVLDALAEFAANGGAVLMVTHDARASARASRILGMDDGRLCLP